MKIKHRAISLLLSLMMVLTFMPAMAFATDSNQIPDKIEFKGDLVYAGQFVESDESFAFEGFYDKGNKLIVHYPDHTKVLVIKEYQLPGEGEDDEYSLGYFAEGEEPKFEMDEDGNWFVINEEDVYGTINPEGLVTVKYMYKYENDEGYEDEGEIATAVQAKEYNEPVSVTYSGPALVYEPWDKEKKATIFKDGGTITVTFRDGSTRKAVYRKFATYEDDGNTVSEYDYFWQGEDPIPYITKDGNHATENGLNWNDHLYDECSNGTVTVKYQEYFYDAYFEATQTLTASPRTEKWAVDVVTKRWAGDYHDEGISVYDKNDKDAPDAEITSVKSSKKSVIKVIKHTDKDSRGNKYTMFWLEAKKAGKATITVKYKTPSGKTGTLKKTIRVKKYPKPVKSLKVNGKTVKVSDNKYFFFQKTSKKSVKVKMTPKKGWKIMSVNAVAFTKNDNTKKISVKKTQIKNGKAISFPKKYKELNLDVEMTNGKDTITYTVFFNR